MAKVFAFTFARGGSKGVPRKNIRLLGGKPLLIWSTDFSLQLPWVEKHYVSTDDAEISLIASQGCADVILRPKELASDTASEWQAWQHAVKYLIEKGVAHKDDVFLSVPATSPLRTVEDVEGAMKQFEENAPDILVTGILAQRSPYFNMLKKRAELPAGYELVIPSGAHRRQDAPVCYDMTTVCYITTFQHILSASSVLDGEVDLFCVNQRSAIDIDTEYDFRLAEFLLSKKNEM